MTPHPPTLDPEHQMSGGGCEALEKGLNFGIILKSRARLKAPALRGARVAPYALLAGGGSVFSSPRDLVGNSCRWCN